MPKRSFRLHDGQHGSALAIRVTPKASRNAIVGVLDDGTIKVHLTAPPVEGEANQALLDFLAEVLDVPKYPPRRSSPGDNGRDKLISVLDMDAQTVHKRILAHLSD